MKFVIAIALTLTMSAAAPSPYASYTGKWTLDKNASRDLPPHLTSVREWRLDVAADPGTLHVKVNLLPEEGEAVASDFRYRLDGQPAPVQVTVRTPAGLQKVDGLSTTTTAADGTLEIATTIEGPSPDGTQKMTTTERWTVKDNVLTVRRKHASPNGAMEYDLVFRR